MHLLRVVVSCVVDMLALVMKSDRLFALAWKIDPDKDSSLDEVRSRTLPQ